MVHPEESELLGLAEGALPPDARAALMAHLDACARCRQVLGAAGSPAQSMILPLDEVPDASKDRTQTGDPLIGVTLGEYRVLERLGQGGMGILYRGEQPVIGKAVAIKLMLADSSEDPNAGHRLVEEARAVNAIRHPNIVDIFSFGQLPDGRQYMVMELLEGQSLANLLRARGRLAVRDAVSVLSQALAALEAAHAAGVIHRDLKPDNIFVDLRLDGWVVTLLDFGLAKRKGADSITGANVALGTPGYMAPEQIRGKRVSPKADIYAMGVVAWHLLAGREPFEGGSVVEVMRRHLDEPAPDLPPECSAVPRDFAALIQKMLDKDADRRPTAGDVRKALLRLSRELPAGETLKHAPPLMRISSLHRPAGLAPAEQGREAQPTLKQGPALMRIESLQKPAPTEPSPAVPDPAAEAPATRRLRAEAAAAPPPPDLDGHRRKDEAGSRRGWALAFVVAAALLTLGLVGFELIQQPPPPTPPPPVVATETNTEPPPPPAPIVTAPPDVVPPPPPVAKPARPSPVPSQGQLEARINQLEKRLKASGGTDVDPNAMTLLNKQGFQLSLAKTPAERRNVVLALDRWEATFLQR